MTNPTSTQDLGSDDVAAIEDRTVVLPPVLPQHNPAASPVDGSSPVLPGDPAGSVQTDPSWEGMAAGDELRPVQRPRRGPHEARHQVPAVLSGRAERAGTALSAAVVCVGAGLGLGLPGLGYVVVVAVLQVLLLIGWTVGVRPANRYGVALLGLLAAVACDVAMVVSTATDLTVLAAVAGLALLVAAGFQLARGQARYEVTESLGSAMLLVVVVSALAAGLTLVNADGGPQLLALCLFAAAAGMTLSNLVDTVAGVPALGEHNDRGLIGLVLGVAAGAAVGYVSYQLLDTDRLLATLIGAGIALVAVLTDVGRSFAETEAHSAGQHRHGGLLRTAIGPLQGVAVTMLVAYAVGLLVLAN